MALLTCSFSSWDLGINVKLRNIWPHEGLVTSGFPDSVKVTAKSVGLKVKKGKIWKIPISET